MVQESDKRVVEHGDFRISLQLAERSLGNGFELRYWVRHSSVKGILYYDRKKIREPGKDTVLDKAIMKLTGSERRSIKEQIEEGIEEVKEMLDDKGEQLVSKEKEKLRQLNNLVPGEIPEERRTAYAVNYRTVPEEAQDEEFESSAHKTCAISAMDLQDNGIRNRSIVPRENEDLISDDIEGTEIRFDNFHHGVKVMEALEEDEVEDIYSEYNFIAEVLELFHEDYWEDEDMTEQDAKYDLDALVEKLKDNFPEEETE